MIKQLIQILARLEVQADYRDLQDILWLSHFLPSGPTEKPAQLAQPVSAPPTAPVSRPHPSPPTELPDKVSPPLVQPLYAVSAPAPTRKVLQVSESTPQKKAKKVRVPGVPALPHALPIARAFRPFARRVLSRQLSEFDEEATVKYIGDGGPVTPIWRPALERWFEVALVVEEAPSMGVWQQTIAELQQLLTRHGAFQDVRRWRFQVVAGKVRLSGLSAVSDKPQQLRHPTARRLILVISDCVSEGWSDGTVARLLNL